MTLPCFLSVCDLDAGRQTDLNAVSSSSLGEFARTETPILSALRSGRTSSLQTRDRGVRGIVTGDILWRLVARTVAQQMMPVVEAATAPYQYALSTRD